MLLCQGKDLTMEMAKRLLKKQRTGDYQERMNDEGLNC